MKYFVDKKMLPVMWTIDVIGSVLLFWKKMRKLPVKPKKVLFMRTEHIGDMIMALPAFETFKKNNPDCEVHVLCRGLTAPLLEKDPYVDKAIIYDAPWFAMRNAKVSKSFSTIVKELRAQEYDVVFEMHADPRNIILSSLLGAYVVGYAARGLGFLVNKTKYYFYEGKKHIIDHNLSLVEDFGKKRIVQKHPVIFVDDKFKKSAAKIMKEHGLKKGKFIIINPLSGRKEKGFTYEEVTKFLKEKKDETIVITGSTAEMAANSVYEKFPNVINLCGKTNLMELIEVVRAAKMVYATDTGIIHMANSVGTYFIAVYKTNTPEYCGYFKNGKNIVLKDGYDAEETAPKKKRR